MLRDIKVLHIEPTDVCQAACPMCARETDVEFDQTQHHHLDMQKIQQVFDADRIAGLDKMFMCGNYGDPAAGKHTLDIYRKFRQLNPNIVLGMNTNGALQNTVWWQELGKMFNHPQDYVVFSIDGLENTNHVYRKNVDWHKLMSNVRSFIKAGGSAHWDMLVYKHNQHQVDACEKLAKDIGFKWFRAKVSKRGFNTDIVQPVGWMSPHIQSTTINCHALNERSSYIDAQGRQSPCCWLGSRQNRFVTDFESICATWHTDRPNSVCSANCGTQGTSTSFSNQWQRNICLN
jgi:MoaA/NifB/PqqE/SkfB family radical SAM enzyme